MGSRSADTTNPPDAVDGDFSSQPAQFRSLPFSSAVRANHYPTEIQQRQVENIFNPLWAILPMNTLPGQTSVTNSVSATIREARDLVRSGNTLESVIGKQCNIAAVYDRKQYDDTTLLSKWAAGIVFSIQYKNKDFATFGMMHLMWAFARWMVEPSPESYEALPGWQVTIFRIMYSSLFGDVAWRHFSLSKFKVIIIPSERLRIHN